MKLIILAVALVGCLAKPQDPLAPVESGIMDMVNRLNLDGSFQFGFSTENQKQEASGRKITLADGSDAVAMEGRYSYQFTDDDGISYQRNVAWSADENGFKADDSGVPPAPGAV